MKRIVLFVSLLLLGTTLLWGGLQKVKVYNRLTKQTVSYPLITVRQMEEVPLDSLIKADAIQVTSGNDTARLQYSPYYHGEATGAIPDGDTVIVQALVLVPFGVINFTAEGYTYLLCDTVSSYPWGGVFVRVDNEPQADADGFQTPVRGDIIQIALVVREFPPSGGTFTLNSQTEPAPVPGIPITIIGHKSIPAPVHKNASDFYHGKFQAGGSVQFSTGEPYENMIVELTNLDYDGQLTTGTGRYVFHMVDSAGNELTSYDASRWFTTRTDINNNNMLPYRDPASTWAIPPVGSHIDTIRGYMQPVSGSQNLRGYRVTPIYPGDVVIGNIKPTMSTHRRNPVVVTTTDTARITIKVKQGTFKIDSTSYPKLYYSVNFGAYNSIVMAKDSLGDTVYHGKIPPQALNTTVSYFMKVQDTTGLNTMYASAHPSLGSDTSKGKFFYKVLSGQPSIYDVQYTPYINGYSPYIGAKVMISGTVTADTNHLGVTSITGFGTYVYYIQSGNAPWNGIWVQAPESLMHGVINGDSILVRGTVGEGTGTQFVTQIFAIDSTFVIAHNKPVPSPIAKTTGTFGAAAGNGTATAEPYEGMLVKFANLTVTDRHPYFSDATMFAVSDGSGDIYVRRDGTNNYSNQDVDTALGKQIIQLGDKIDTLIGIIFFDANRWCVVPRANDDFRSAKYYSTNTRWNMVSVPQRLPSYVKSVVYPNPPAVSPAYTYDGGYVVKDTLKNGVGYWLKFNGAQNLRYNGLSLTNDTIPVKPGWNMVGGITNPVDVGTITQNPTNNIKSSFYQYNNGYSAVTTIDGGRGYWVKVQSAGYIVLTAAGFNVGKERVDDASALQTMNSVTITDRTGKSQTMYFGPEKDGKFDLTRYEMPPPPPPGEFDARFTSQRLAELYPNQLKAPVTFALQLTSAAYPISVEWSITDHDPNRSFSIASDDKNAKSYVMAAQGSAVIKSAKDNLLTLTVNNSGLPKQFALSQNYPNPFNPTTKFTFAVPQLAHVEIVVYDILGRKVKTLLSEDKGPGYYEVEWTGVSEANTSVASGVYFVRMNSDRFNAVRKIMMMK